jgi:hypothetical protein
MQNNDFTGTNIEIYVKVTILFSLHVTDLAGFMPGAGIPRYVGFSGAFLKFNTGAVTIRGGCSSNLYKHSKMKKILIVIALCGFNLAVAADGTSFRKKFERKIAAVTPAFQFGKKVSACITVEVTSEGKTRVVTMDCASPKEGEKLKKEIEKMQFSDTTCTGTHKVQLSIEPQQK